MKFILIMASALSFNSSTHYPEGECVRLFDSKEELNEYFKSGKVPESCSLDGVRIFESKEVKATVKMKKRVTESQVPDGVELE